MFSISRIFYIVAVRVVPNESACIDVIISASKTKIYDRTLCIDGDAYTAWISDDYLYTYIQANISTIF